MMALWTWKICVRGYDSSKKDERRVKKNLKESRPRTSRSGDMIERVEQMVMEDRRLTVKQDSCQCRHIHWICGHHLAWWTEIAEIMRNHVFRSASAWLRLLRFVFTRRSSFFELSYPRTHIFHVHNAIIACLIQLLMNFDGFHATQVEESDNHALFFECKRHHFQYLKHYWHSTTSQACNG